MVAIPPMQVLLKDVLRLQCEWSWRNTLAMQQRGLLIERDVAAWLRELLPELSNLVPPVVDDFQVAAGDGSGRRPRFPGRGCTPLSGRRRPPSAGMWSTSSARTGNASISRSIRRRRGDRRTDGSVPGRWPSWTLAWRGLGSSLLRT
jgi:hypothetical protein